METLAILIPVKNNANIVATALDSVVNQTAFLNGIFKYEIFLVDNDSSDNLKEVVNKYENLTYLFCKIPGIVAALNTGVFHIMNLSHIKYIARIDADDIWLSNKIEIQFSYMLKNPNIDICGTAIRFIKGSSYQEWHYGEKHSQMMADMNIGQNPIAHPSVIYKKDIFYKCGGYDETFRYNEDLDLWMRASKHFTFHNMQDVLLHYNLEQKSDAYHKEQDNNAKKLHLRNLIINDRLSINRE
jgi:glycosyltransferase involved in cell wall biosynthesis